MSRGDVPSTAGRLADSRLASIDWLIDETYRRIRDRQERVYAEHKEQHWKRGKRACECVCCEAVRAANMMRRLKAQGEGV
ncbi:MAG: hypothetical protein EPO02_13170 [Nitrospirae bacterium]|nr:MAG: hypothetical protein EPO02_13170 [Nitrospirota bacterium]